MCHLTSTSRKEANQLNFFKYKNDGCIATEANEGVSIEGEGTIGLITYLRTDSTRIAAEADTAKKSIY